MEKFDYLIVGSGLFGATFAYRVRRAGKRCLVIDNAPDTVRLRLERAIIDYFRP